MHSFELRDQVKLVLCCFMIHNFIRLHQGYEDEFDEWRVQEDFDGDREDHEDDGDNEETVNWWNGIAQKMWDDYVTYQGLHA